MSDGTGSAQWTLVDEGWGRKVADFSTLSELGNCREYVAMHHRLGLDAGDLLLDMACGSGLAIELARLRGASCSGIDASARLVAVAARAPEVWRTAKGLELFGPRRFGFAYSYTPVEKLLKSGRDSRRRAH